MKLPYNLKETNYRYTNKNKIVKIVGHISDSQVIVQDVYYDDKENAITGGEPYAKQKNDLFETPVKPAEWVWLEQDLARLKKARVNTENKVCQEIKKLDNYVCNVNKYSEWLRKLAYNAKGLNLKTQEMLINMSILYSNKRKWIVKFGWYSIPVVDEFKNLKDVNFAKYMVGGEYHSLRYFGINANPDDAEDNDMYFCTTDPCAWNDRRDKILLFDDKKLFLRTLQQWLDERNEYSIDTIKFAKKYKLKLDNKKVEVLKERLLHNAKYEVDKLTTELNKAKKNLSKCNHQIKTK